MPDEDTPPTLLNAGPLTLAFDRGELRWIRLGEREVLRGIYAAVRSPDWSTVPAALESLAVDAGTDSFSVSFEAVHRAGPVWFEWTGRLEGSPEGRVRFDFDGVARSTFLRNRIGICVLHPAGECAGAACTVGTTDGAEIPGTFPRLVSPHQPFLGIRSIRHVVAPGVEAEVRFEGEVFEMEDQRNWSDASFKTYSTPLALPVPVEVREGERIRQAVTLSLLGEPGSREERSPVTPGWLSEDPVQVAVSAGPGWPLPRLGLGLGAVEPATEPMARLRTLAPAHLRVDVRPSESTWRETLARASEVARGCRTGLEVAAFVPAETRLRDLTALADAARDLNAPLDAWLVFDEETLTTTPELAASARESFVGPAAAPTLGGGTDGFFAELNRERAASRGLDLVCLSLNPQVHAFDDATLVENLSSLSEMAETARSFSGDTPLALSPVTLLPRPGRDPRQRTLFGAGWTLGLVAAAAEAGFGRMTLFETGGVMEEGELAPVGHVLAELAALAASAPEARVVAASPSDPSRCLTLGVQAGSLLRLYVFNPTPRSLEVTVAGLAASAWHRSFRSGGGAVPGGETGQKLTAEGNRHRLQLDGHEVVALDADLEAP